MFELARGYREHGMTAYADLQQAEFANADAGYTAVKHQHEVGASYFEEVALAITGGESETTSVRGSTEASQFSRA
jgi:isocitrate lyase